MRTTLPPRPRRPRPSLLPAALLLLGALSCSGDPTGPGDERSTRLVFAGHVDLNWDIYSVLPDGTGLRRLTTGPEDDLQPGVSRDGRRIAFHSKREPAGLYVMDADGGNVRLVHALSAAEERADQVSWSPDGRKLAFETREGIKVVRVDGTGGVTRLPGSSPDWAPDGRGLAVSLRGGIYRIGEDGREQELLMANADGPAWSADGRQLAFSRPAANGRWAVWRAHLDGSAAVQLSTPTGQEIDGGPAWSPDAGQVAFTRTDLIASVWVVNADGTGLRQLAPPLTTFAGGTAW